MVSGRKVFHFDLDEDKLKIFYPSESKRGYENIVLIRSARVERVYADARDENHSAEQAALNGVNKAQHKAEEITIRNIDELTQRSQKAIDTMVLESKRRIEQVKENAKANPNADKDKVEEESQKAEEGVTEKPSGETGEPSSKPNTGSNSGDSSSKPEGGNSGGQGQSSSSNGNSGSSSGGGNSGGNSGTTGGGGGSKPQHTHDWEAQTTTVHHDAQYQTVHHDAVIEYHTSCNKCGMVFGSQQEASAHMKQQMLQGDNQHSYGTNPVEVSPAWDETVEVSPAWDETVTTDYKCSGCGATK